MSDYEGVPYRGLPVRAADPWQMAWTARVHGGPRPDLERARVLEIGCGDAANLLPLAAHHPAWRAHGIDLSEHAIAEATRLARDCGIANATFERADVAAIDVEPGTWDFVIAHGLYSWIDADRRSALLRAIRRALAPAGLAYVSFNAMPGWKVRGSVRRALASAGPGLEAARALAAKLEAQCADDAWGRLCAHELSRVRLGSDAYVVHEYFERDNDAFWLSEMVRDAESCGLRWIGDAQFDLREGRTFEALRAGIGVEGRAGDELADLIGYRQFRCAVLSRDDADIAGADPLDEAVISGVVAATSDPFTLDAAVEESMRSAEGIEVRVRDPLAKMALLELARIYPDGLGFADLCVRARSLSSEHGHDTEPSADLALRRGIASLWRAGALEMRLGRARVGADLSERPRVSELARREAATRGSVTSRLHVGIPLDAIGRELALRLDGSRTVADLETEFANVDFAPQLATLARWGVAT